MSIKWQHTKLDLIHANCNAVSTKTNGADRKKPKSQARPVRFAGKREIRSLNFIHNTNMTSRKRPRAPLNNARALKIRKRGGFAYLGDFESTASKGATFDALSAVGVSPDDVMNDYAANLRVALETLVKEEPSRRDETVAALVEASRTSVSFTVPSDLLRHCVIPVRTLQESTKQALASFFERDAPADLVVDLSAVEGSRALLSATCRSRVFSELILRAIEAKAQTRFLKKIDEFVRATSSEAYFAALDEVAARVSLDDDVVPFLAFRQSRKTPTLSSKALLRSRDHMHGAVDALVRACAVKVLRRKTTPFEVAGSLRPLVAEVYACAHRTRAAKAPTETLLREFLPSVCVLVLFFVENLKERADALQNDLFAQSARSVFRWHDSAVSTIVVAGLLANRLRVCDDAWVALFCAKCGGDAVELVKYDARIRNALKHRDKDVRLHAVDPSSASTYRTRLRRSNERIKQLFT